MLFRSYNVVVAYVFKVTVAIKDTLLLPARITAVRKIATFTSILVSPRKTNVTATEQDELDA